MNTTSISETGSRPRAAAAAAPAQPSPQVMRQTQALMGAVLLAGTAAAYFVNAAWMVVPLIVGTGLVFAGVSGKCPMASLIARMPWNRAAAAKSCSNGGSCCQGRPS